MKKSKEGQKEFQELKTQLFEAAKANDVGLFVELVDQGIDPFIKDEKGIAAISYISSQGLAEFDSTKMLEMLATQITKFKSKFGEDEGET